MRKAGIYPGVKGVMSLITSLRCTTAIRNIRLGGISGEEIF
jgi:hypothetical protein